MIEKQPYSKSYRDYLELKIDVHDKRNKVISDVKEWFELFHPQIILKSVYVNPRPMIDQLCLILDKRLPAKIINEFCNEFELDLKTELYRIRRQHNFNSRNEHKDSEKWTYSFMVRI